MNKFTVYLALVACLYACAPKGDVAPPSPVHPIPSPAQLAWHRMETNAFIHFTINTFTEKEWGYGDEDPSLFNPSSLDVDQWITTLKEAGMKGVILTTKHHDGFCLWPSAYTGHSIKKSPYRDGKGDLVKEVSDACRRHGLSFGIYVSPWDRNHAKYGSPEYVTYYRKQLEELFQNYGPFFEMWFDGANGGDGYYGGAREKRRIDGSQYYDWPGTLNMVSTLAPDVLFFSDAGPHIRWVGNEKGIAGETNWNAITPDTLYAGKAGIEGLLQTGSEKGTKWIPAEVDVSIRPGWFYHQKEDSLVKSPEKLFEIYLTSVGRGSTLLLNVPPDRRGLIHEKDVAALRQWRQMIDSTFATDLGGNNASAEASSFRGESAAFAPANVLDGDPATYWATDDNVTSGEITIGLSKSQRIRYVTLREPIELGQRVRKFRIEVRDGEGWKQVGEGTTIGYKRIVDVGNVDATYVRVSIEDSRACPLISEISVH